MLVQNRIQTITGVKAIIRTLKSLGVNTVFGYPGGIVLDIYNELYDETDIKHILVRHEQSAVHAAEGYARVTDKCGVALVTSGPGATNTITGIANAYLDGYPLLVLTGQVVKQFIGKNAFQEVNICDIARSCTKAVFQITDAKDIQDTIIKAYQIATSGKKGPVVIDLSKNIFTQNTQYNTQFEITKDNINNEIQKFRQIYDQILKSHKPVIISGGGVCHSKSYKELKQFCDNYNIPVVSTMMGIEGLDNTDIHYIGMIGIFGDNCANEILREADLIISLGSRFNDRITCMFKNGELENKIIQVDVNSNEISNNIKAKDYIISDVKDFLSKMNNLCDTNLKKQFREWNEKIKEFKNLNKSPQKTTNMIHSFEIMKKLEDFTKNKDVIFTSEVGQHQIWAIKNLKFKPDRKILVSGGSGTMGFGFPAAIGASIACPEKTIVCISGDGSLQMSLGELSVCKDYGLNIKILILNNGYLGMVRQLQEKNYNKRYSQTKISNPDFVKIANSFGIDAMRVNCVNNIENALEQAFSTDKTFIIEFLTEPMETL